MRPLWPLERPSETFGKLVLVEGGERGRLARDPGQPIWVLLTWRRGPDDLPTPPACSGREGLGVTPPPPTQLQFPGGVTPRITFSSPLPPHQAEGNVGTPPEDSRFQVRRGPWGTGMLLVI